jgi:site-specific recombinase XerD
MKIRHFAAATIDAYTYHVDKFDQFLGDKNASDATPEDIRSFQLHLIEVRKVGWSSFNQAVCGLRFLYSISLPRDWPVVMIPFGKRKRSLPTVLSGDQVEELLQCTPNLKQRTFLKEKRGQEPFRLISATSKFDLRVRPGGSLRSATHFSG